jgi:nitrite reductase/ring-hydroxylating ferredoxin subunit
VRLFVVRKDGVLAAYRNRCPHTGAPLEWLPDQFLDLENSFIECALHGALFRPEDGYCLRGPCVGASLEGLELEVVDGRVQVTLPVPE